MQKTITTVTAFSAAFAITACIVQQDPAYQQPYPQQGQQGQQDPYQQGQYGNAQEPVADYGIPNGDYSCSFRSSGYDYPAYTCVVFTDGNGQQILQKVRGSQRIRGSVNVTDQGFSFQGTFFCPYGACTQATSANFVAYDDGLYKGTLNHSSGAVEVTLQYQPGGFGGADYGYGGAQYGGTIAVPPSY